MRVVRLLRAAFKGAGNISYVMILLISVVTARPAVAAAACSGPVRFGPPLTINMHTPPYFVVLADLNADGRDDIVVDNYNQNSVSILLNSTSPESGTSFAVHQDFATGHRPTSIAVGDLNADGRVDLVIADNGNDDVSVLLNTSSPGTTTLSFAPRQKFQTGAGPLSTALADFNADGRPDIAITNSDTTISVMLNNTPNNATTSSFSPHQDFAAGDRPRSLVVADFNGDGAPDLAAVHSEENSLSVLVNNTPAGSSTPSFVAKQKFTTGINPYSLSVSDFNADNRPDLAVAHPGDQSISVLLNTTMSVTTTLSFTPRETMNVGSVVISVAAGDLDSDGRPDLVAANMFPPSTATVLFNATPSGDTMPKFVVQSYGSRSFETQSADSLAIGNLNSDTSLDLVITIPGSWLIYVLPNLSCSVYLPISSRL